MTTTPPPLDVALTGFDLINQPMLNKGTAFTEEERGLLPPHVGCLEEQVVRRPKLLRVYASNFARYSFLRDLYDSNQTPFHALLVNNIEELPPLAYTPTRAKGVSASARSGASRAISAGGMSGSAVRPACYWRRSR